MLFYNFIIVCNEMTLNLTKFNKEKEERLK